MPTPRTYTDEQLRDAISNSTRWSDVLVKLGKSPRQNRGPVMTRAKALGIDTSHMTNLGEAVTAPAHDFPGRPQVGVRGKGGLSVAAGWFLERGYNVSIPLEPGPYDLIAESEDGLRRIQVKMTSTIRSTGRYEVRLARTIYDSSAPANGHGRYRKERYGAGEVDYFFVITASGTNYLIPRSVVGDSMYLHLDTKYRDFEV